MPIDNMTAAGGGGPVQPGKAALAAARGATGRPDGGSGHLRTSLVPGGQAEGAGPGSRSPWPTFPRTGVITWSAPATVLAGHRTSVRDLAGLVGGRS
jgi:hypothetical protein